MFDDPKRSLRRMEEDLKAAEFESDFLNELDLEGLLGQPETEEDDWLAEAKAMMGEEKPAELRPRRGAAANDAVDFRRTVFADEGGDTAAVYVDKKNRKRWKEEKKRGVGCLPILLVLELIGIAVLSWWWLRWFR